MSNRNTIDGLKVSHAYIIASPNVEIREKKALELAMAFVCAKGKDTACMKCKQCKTALAGTHPDITEIKRAVDDKGKQKKEILVDQIRALSADAIVRPSQAEKKVYIISDAGYMNVQAQNAALKLFEEPPVFDVFILCADSAEELLPTVRSRCSIIRLNGEKEHIENKYSKRYLEICSQGDRQELCAFCSKCESMDTSAFADMISGIRYLASDAIRTNAHKLNLSFNQAMKILELCDRADKYMSVNVSTKHILGLLCVLPI